jgi:hypothetical protein
MASTTTSSPPIGLAQISLRQRERGFVCGGVDTGKSTLADLLSADFLQRYYAAGARRLILDTKPRYRAQDTLQGRSAKSRYKKWDHGPAVPGSVVVDDPEDLALAWQLGYRTVIGQGNGDDHADIRRLSVMAQRFNEDARRGRPQLLHVDESMDFYHTNGAPIGGVNSLVRAARATRERGGAALYGTQRTKNIPTTLITEMSRCYEFRLDAKGDAKRLQEMGMPECPMPTETHQFMYWWKGDYDRVWGPYRLQL